MKRFARRSRARALRQLVRRALAPPHARGILRVPSALREMSFWKATALTLTLNAA